MRGIRTWVAAVILGLCFQTMLFAETIGIFADTTIGQIQFAAGDVKNALQSKGFSVEQLALSSLSSGYANKKVVIALSSNTQVTSVLTEEGGTIPAGLGEQAYGLRTTTQSQTSYWALGGDINGAMYGGLQLAENITGNGFAGTFNNQESPFLLNRGMKLNLPLDSRIPTYVGGWSSESAQKAIPSVWDTTYWTTLIDEQARRRYNMLSVWVHHPFPALVQVADYPNACLPNITGYNDGYTNNMNITQRIAFWRKIMTYAHNRGFTFYFFNWNVYVDYASSQYPTITRDQSNSTTKDYTYKSMQALIDTYPELDGFGISAGDGMSGSVTEKTDWTWASLGKAVYDYLSMHPNRKFNLIHRSIGTDPTTVFSTYSPLSNLSNGNVDFSVKYAMAHMYSTPTPNWTGDISTVAAAGRKTWLTWRNEDFFYLNWGDPKFVRDYMTGIPHKASVIGTYIGSDGYNPTRTYFSKNNALNGQLEVQRKGYMEMLWGRLGYNPQTSDTVFINYMASRYPSVTSPGNLFKAWALASRPLAKVTELVQGSWPLDFDWYPEMCYSEPGRGGGFKTIEAFAAASVANGSSLCNIATSATNNCGSAKSSYALADEIKADADSAYALITSIGDGGNADAALAIENVKQLTYLSEYYAYKIRGATYKQARNTANARDAMGKAYCWWIAYSTSMDNMYLATSYRNVEVSPNLKFADGAVLKEYNDLGGMGTPACEINHTYTLAASSGSNGSVTPTGNITVNSGASQVFTITPVSGYKVDAVTVDGANQGSITTYTFNNVTANHSISATFRIIPLTKYTITASTDPNGSISPSGNAIVDSGSSQTFAITANSGYEVDVVTVDGASQGAITSYTFDNVTENHSISATFKAAAPPRDVSFIGSWVQGTTHAKEAGNKRALVVMLYGEGSGNISANSVTYGGQLMTKVAEKAYLNGAYSYTGAFVLAETGIAAASSGNIAVTWSAAPSSGFDVTSAFFSDVNQTSPIGATASNGLLGATITTSPLANSAGSLVLVAGTAGSNGTYSINNGFLRGINETSATFGDITSAYKATTGTAEEPSLTMSGSMRQSIVAFVLNKAFGGTTQFTITASAGLNGSISPSGNVMVNSGANQTITITANSGYQVDMVTVDGVSQGSIGSYTFNNVTGNHSISATFKSIPATQFTITASTGLNGSISPSGNVTVNSGANQTFTITAKNGWLVDKVTVDGISQGSITTYTFNNVTANHSISVTFRKRTK